MSKSLDIDKKIELWFPALEAIKNGSDPVCPRCNSNNIEVTAEKNKNNGGYVLITCCDCNKSGYFSRVIFENWNSKFLDQKKTGFSLTVKEAEERLERGLCPDETSDYKPTRRHNRAEQSQSNAQKQ